MTSVILESTKDPRFKYFTKKNTTSMYLELNFIIDTFLTNGLIYLRLLKVTKKIEV